MLDLQHRALTRPVRPVERFGDDAVEAGALEAGEPVGHGVAVERRGRHVDRWLRAGEHRLEPRPPIAERRLAQRLVAEREQVEGDVGRRYLHRQLVHARLGGMLAQLQRVEVETAFVRDDELAVEHDAFGELREQRLAKLGEVAQQRLAVPALQIEVVTVAEDDAAEAVPLRLVRHQAGGRQLARELGEHRVERRPNGKVIRAASSERRRRIERISSRSPVARTLRSTNPTARPFAPTTSCTGMPSRSASANFTPGRDSRSSNSTDTPAPRPFDADVFGRGKHFGGSSPRPGNRITWTS